MTDSTTEFMRKLLETFRVEAEEHLRDIVANIVSLEQGGAQGEVLAHILKRLHTLKGAARAVNLGELENLAHAMESVFSGVNSQGAILTPEQFDVLHQACALIPALLDPPSGRTRNQAASMTRRLERVAEESAGEQLLQQQAPAQEQEVETADEPPAPVVNALPKIDVIRVQSRSLDAIRYQAEALLSVELGLQHHLNDLLRLAEEMEEQADREYLTQMTLQRMQRLAGQRELQETAHALADPVSGSERFAARCRLVADSLRRTHRSFSLIRARLMDATLETALVPFGSSLEQLPGLVRNLARRQGKEAVLRTEGDDIELDRRVLDIVREALMHLVTNAIAHGVEAPPQRIDAGKPAAGTIHIAARQQGTNRIAVSVADDGAGIDVDALVQAALAGGKLDAAQLAGLGDQQKLQLALHAGVSTSAQLTRVAGRGVGMTVVADSVATVGGELRIDNRPGAGCRFELLLPVRLATMRGLMLRIQDTRFVFPLAGMDAVRAVREGDLRTVEGRETLLHGGQIIPALRLAHLLGIAASGDDEGGGIAVIAHAGEHCFALLVDELLYEQEVLPKSLGKQLRRVRFIAGAAQLGDGQLIPILALDDIAKYGLAPGETAAPATRPSERQATRKLLVVEDSITSRLLLKHILEGAGYEVSTAVDGLDALSQLRQTRFDAVVSDVEMPQMDGLALTERLRANPETEELPVILVTSLQSAEEKERGLRAGADAYVVKGSFDQDNLLATIRRLI